MKYDSAEKSIMYCPWRQSKVEWMLRVRGERGMNKQSTEESEEDEMMRYDAVLGTHRETFVQTLRLTSSRT